MYLNCDIIAVRDPTFLFDDPAFKETGTIFWKGIIIFMLDIWRTRKNNTIMDILEIENTETFGEDSGLIVIRKGEKWKSLNLATFLQTNPKFTPFLHGEKNSFIVSWRAMKEPYHM
jgi:hypothetical protein